MVVLAAAEAEAGGDIDRNTSVKRWLINHLALTDFSFEASISEKKGNRSLLSANIF